MEVHSAVTSIRCLAAAPTPTSFEGIVRSFGAEPREGVVSAYDDDFGADLLGLVERHPHLQNRPFPAFARDCAVAAGVPAPPIASGAEWVAAVRVACRRLPAEDPFARVARFPAFHRLLARTLSELADFGFSPERLAEASIADRAVTAKLRSLARIGDAAAERLRARGMTTLSRLVAATVAEPAELDVQLERVLIFAGSTFSPCKLDLLRWLAGNGAEVTLVTDHALAPSVYAGSARTHAYLGIEPRPLLAANRLVSGLFGRAAEGDLLLPGGVAIHSVGDPLAECEWTLRAVLEDPIPSSLIVVRDLDAYAPLLVASARRLEVPLRIRRSEPLLANGLARAVLCVAESLAESRPDALLAALDCRYAPLSRGSRERLALAVREAEEPWAGFDLPLENSMERAWLDALLAIKRGSETGASGAEWANAFRRVAEADFWAIPTSDREHADGSRDERARHVILRLLDDLADEAEPEPIGLADFLAELRRSFEDAAVWVPAAPEAITVISDPAGSIGAERVFGLGLLEGSFPRRQREDAILDDEERAALSAAAPDLPALDDSVATAGRERDAFARLCALATERLILSHPRAEGERDNVPAFYLKAVEAAHPVESVHRLIAAMAPPAESRIALADRDLGAALDAQPVASGYEPDARARRVAHAAIEKVALRDLEILGRCPFHFSMRHTFRLRLSRGGFDARLARLARDARLFEQPTLEAARQGMRAALDAALGRGGLDAFEIRAARIRGEAEIERAIQREFASRLRWGPRPPAAPSVAEARAPGLDFVVDLEPAARFDLNGTPLLVYERGGDGSCNETNRWRRFLLWYLEGACERPLVVESESSGGDRWRWLFGNLPGSPADARDERDAGRDLVASDGGSPRWKKIGRQLRQAVADARSGDLDLRVGEHCAACDFADLCRHPDALEVNRRR